MALKVGELFATMNLKDEGFSSGLSKMGKLFGGSLVGMTAAATAAAGVAMKSIVNTGKSFEAAMSEVQAISGATGKELELLSQTAKEYGSTTSFTASESAEALKYMALAGWDAAESAAALPGVLNLAAASGMELGTASDYVTDYISAFGMKCEEATYLADLMAKAQATSNTSALQLGEAYKNCAANLHASGQDVETTTSLLMTMANQGLKGAEAGTALSAIMRDITQKMDNGAIKIGNASVAVADANGNFRDMTAIMSDVQAATAGMGTAEKNAALLSTFTARSIKGVNLILNEGVDAAAAYETSLRGATGTAADQAATMLDNLVGDITIFKSALEGLQIDLYESMNGMMREGVQGATGLVQQLQAAFQQGMNPAALEGVLDSAFDLLGNFGSKAGDMVVNITDAFARVTPRLAKGLSRGLSDVLGKVGRQMPKLAKNLFSALPDVLGAAGDLLPDLADSLFDTVGGALEQVIGDLPRLLPELAKGFGKLFLSALEGAGNLLDSIGKGIWDALGKAGWRDLSLDEVWKQQFDSADGSKIDLGEGLVTYSFDTEIDPGDYQEEIDAAVQEIHNALLNIPGLSEDQLSAIEDAIMKGSGAEALETALAALEIPDASGVASKITAAMTTISSALSSTGLSAEAQQKVADIAAAGGDVKQALIDLGIDPETASTVASQITSATSQISTACAGLDIDTSTLVSNATTDKGQIVAALKLLGLDGVDIDTIVGNLDTVAGSLSAVYVDLFDDIAQALTNGIPDDKDPDLDAAKTKLEAYIQAAHDKLIEWRDAKLQELADSGLTGDAYDTELSNILGTYESMSSKLDELTGQTTEFIDENSGQATSVVQSRLGELQEIANQAELLNAQIDGMVAGAFSSTSAGSKNRGAVEKGLITDQRSQIEAINYTAQERQAALEQASQNYDDAVAKAAEQYEVGSANYNAAVNKAGEDLAAAQENAATIYDQHMSRLIAGIAKSNPEFAAQLAKLAETNKFADMAQKLKDGIEQAASNGEPIDATQLLKNIGFTEADMSALAEELNIDPAEMMDKINFALQSAIANGTGVDTQLGMALNDYIYDALEGFDIADALENKEIDVSALNEVMKRAFDEGLIPEEWIGEDGELSAKVLEVLSNLEYDENGPLITPAMTVAPTFDPAPDTPEKVSEAVDGVVNESGDTKTVEQKVEVGAEVTTAEGAQESVDEALETVAGEDAPPVEKTQEVTVKPDVKPAEGAQQEVSDAMDTVTGEEAPPVEMTMDVNASVGNVTFAEGGSIADKLTALFAEQSVPLALNVSASIASIAFAEGTDLQTSLTTLLPTEALSVDLSAAATLSISSVSLAEGTSLQAAVNSLLASQSLSVALTASATLNITLTDSNANTLGVTEGGSLADGVASGISGGSSGVTSAASALMSAAASSMRSATSSASSIGRSFSAGLASGISAGRSGVVNAAASVARAAAAAARSALSIHSPSKVTEEMGSMFDAGFARGITRSANMAVRSASSLATMAANAATLRRLSPSVAFASALSGSNFNLNIDYDRLADAMNQRPTVFTMNGQRVAEAMRDATARTQAARAQSIALGYGKRY